MTKYVLATAAFTGLLCGIWGGFAGLVGLSAWAGFAGCTAYFASGKHKVSGLVMALVTTFIGVFYGWLMLEGAKIMGGSEVAFTVSIGVLVMCIVLMGQIKFTAFVPGIFVGCYSFFAIDNNNWQLLLSSLAAGILLGVVCDWGGNTLFGHLKPKNKSKK